MALKRSFNISNNKARSCLKCERTLEKDKLIDDTIIICPSCHQEMFVDRYSSTQVVLTVKERPELRRRNITAGMDTAAIILDYSKVKKENTELKRLLEEEKANAKSWEDAAEGLARMVENLKQKDE